MTRWARAVLFAGATAVTAATAACGSRAAPAAEPGPVAAAGPRIVQPGQPGEASTVIDAAAARTAEAAHTRADVDFVQGMIAHHAQAIVMSDLVPARTTSNDILLLARRIAISQHDEIALMQQWLRERGESVPDPAHYMHGDHAHGHGMLSEQELAQLEAANGVEFERLFLQFMIRHHDGALAMVADLFASPGSAQGTDLFRLASEVDTDQRIEIARMNAMLSARN